jgi:hypothetical protein
MIINVINLHFITIIRNMDNRNLDKIKILVHIAQISAKLNALIYHSIIVSPSTTNNHNV